MQFIFSRIVIPVSHKNRTMLIALSDGDACFTSSTERCREYLARNIRCSDFSERYTCRSTKKTEYAVVSLNTHCADEILPAYQEVWPRL